MAIERREVHDVFGNLMVFDVDTDTNIKTDVDTGHSTPQDRQKDIENQKNRASYETVINWFIKLGVD